MSALDPPFVPSSARPCLWRLPTELVAYIVEFVHWQDQEYHESLSSQGCFRPENEALRMEKQSTNLKSRSYGLPAVYGTCRLLRELAQKWMFETVTVNHRRTSFFREHIIPTYGSLVQALHLDHPRDATDLDFYAGAEHVLSLLDLMPAFPNLRHLCFSSNFSQRWCARYWKEMSFEEGLEVSERFTSMTFTEPIDRIWESFLPFFSNIATLSVTTLSKWQQETFAQLTTLELLEISSQRTPLSISVKWQSNLKSLRNFTGPLFTTSDTLVFASQFATSLTSLELAGGFPEETVSSNLVLPAQFLKLTKLVLDKNDDVALGVLRLLRGSPLQCIEMPSFNSRIRNI